MLSGGREICINAPDLMMNHCRGMKKLRKLTLMKPSAGARWVMSHGVASCVAVSLIATSLSVAAESEISLIEQEIQKRSEGVTLAQELLKQGDAAYLEGDFSSAVTAYQKAFELIPQAGLTHEIKSAAADRFAQAAAQNAKSLARTGQYDEARRQLNAALSPNVAPNPAAAKKMLAQLDDPIRTSPTLTLEHVQNIETVGKGLRKADSYYQQGQYDSAIVAYKEVIKIDPYNKAARRGMEKAMHEMTIYYAAAKDERRSAALAEVGALWRKKVIPEDKIFNVRPEDAQLDLVGQVQQANKRKLEGIIVPMVDMQDVSFETALRMIRVWARELDTFELDDTKKGLIFVTRFGDELAGFAPKIRKERITIKLTNVPLSTVLDYVTQNTGTYWRSEQYAVVIRPLGSQTAEMQTRTFRVPLGFLKNAEASENTDDVFGDSDSSLKAKVTAKGYFESLGIEFPKGAGAFYSGQTNTVRVTNTPTALDTIEQLIRAQTLTEKVAVVIKVTILEVSETALNELGYDWLLDPSRFKGNVFIGGGTQGSGNLVPPIGNAGPAAVFNGAPITSGNRSGPSMFPQSAIDERIGGLKVNDGFSSVNVVRAPAALQITGGNSASLVQAIVRGVKQKGGKSRVWTPSIVIAPGQRASLFSGEELLIAEEYEPPEVPNAAGGGGGNITPSTPTAFVKQNVGLTMVVEPTVSDDKLYIDMNVNPVLRQLAGFVNYGSPIQQASVDPITGLLVSQVVTTNEVLMPVFNTLRVNTNVTIQDGHTIVVGGLLQNRIETVNDKVPVLGSLPVVGRFFQSNGVKSTRKAILIFVNAELVDPTGKPWRER